MTAPEDLADRTALEELLLGVPVPLPDLRDGPPTVRLDHRHVSLRMRPDRRLAAVTAVGIDGALLRDVSREGVDWRLDPRLPAGQQTGPEVYARNDRGHLVSRADAVWGTAAEARRANEDTFHDTNAAPQADALNQGEELWLGLEQHLLTHAATYRRRLVVLTAFADAGGLAAAGPVPHLPGPGRRRRRAPRPGR